MSCRKISKVCAFRLRKKISKVCAFRLRKKVFMVFGGRLRRGAARFQECLCGCSIHRSMSRQRLDSSHVPRGFRRAVVREGVPFWRPRAKARCVFRIRVFLAKGRRVA
jgi:hypothetical protein